jgi:hypothetical protein
VVTFANLLQIL